MKESYSIFLGTCLTFCHKRTIVPKEQDFLMLKRGLELGIFIHERGEEELVLARS
jgi:hypothetical protein